MMATKLSTRNILAIDAGNTRIKWGLFNTVGTMLESDACLNTALATAKLPDAAHVVISNVAGNQVQAQLQSLLPKNAHINWISAQSNACGVINRYDQPATLGCDRWAALIAAWHIKQAPCVVVNAGTAVTIDALSTQPQHNQAGNTKNQAEFIGGMILPGLNLMQQSLGHATAQLPKLTLESSPAPQTHTELFAKNTTDAIYAGTLHAILGAITLMAHELNLQCKQAPYIVIGGGNAKVIKDNLMSDVTKQALIVDNLVLQGLYLLENFMQNGPQ